MKRFNIGDKVKIIKTGEIGKIVFVSYEDQDIPHEQQITEG
jgi:hypothetical protein